MNNHLQDCLSKLEHLIAIQEDCISPYDVNSRDYMQGMLNGMILAHAIFDNSRPKYYTMTRRIKNKKVRHKSQILRKESK
jgi:hypothetical protein